MSGPEAPSPPARPPEPWLRATLPALALLALAVSAAVVVRRVWPQGPPWHGLAAAGVIATGALLLRSFRHTAFVHLLLEHDVFFLSGVAAALVWANTDPSSLESLAGPARFVVNEVLMALFFGIAAKEIAESTLPGGPLASLRKAALPLVATVGGMLGPAAVYAAGCWALSEPGLARGWAIPTATDVAFSAMVARLVFGARHPAIPFLLLLAIADDAAGLLVLALAYPKGDLHLLPLVGLVAGGVGACLVLSRLLRIQSPWPYLLLGGVPCWFGLHEGGLHPALCLVPVVSLMPHGHTDPGLYERDEHADSTMERFERGAAAPVSLILGLFGLVNAGVPLAGAGAATWLVLGALLLGKPLGICGAVALGARLGLRLPEGLGARDVVVLGITAGVGFTVSLFVATVAFPAGAELEAAKMGALASVVAAPLALAAGRLLGVRRAV